MSVTLASISLAGVTTASTGTYDFSQVLASQSLPLATQMNPIANAGLLVLFNESNAGLQLTFLDSQHQINLPAGAWRRIPITAADRGFNWKVSYTIPNPLATVVLIDYYRPGELIDEVGALGNSPIGGAITTTTTQQLYANDNLHFFDVFYDSIAQILHLRPESAAIGASLDWTDGVGAHHPGVFVDPAGGFSIVGQVREVAGLNTQGNLGIPIFPGLAFRQHVAVTTAVTLINYTPGTTGYFRLSGYVFINNGTSGNDPTIRVTYTDPDAGAGSLLFRAGSGTATGAFDGASSFLNGRYPIAPMDFVASGGVAITVTYQDPTNTPNDTISMVLTQLD